jgi:anti-anti-sigma factor
VTSTRGPLTFPAPAADRTVVWLRGEHDVSTVSALSQTMARAIALDDGDLVVDLSGVQFMDAATVGVIVRA